MPATPEAPDTLPEPDSPGEDFLFAPTPNFLGSLNPLDLLGVATSPAPREWTPPSPQELTEVLPGYIVTRLVGQGGMGAVYEVLHTMTDRRAALKFLPADRCASDPVFAERARREVRLLSKMDHPNIVRVFDSSTTSAGDFFFTMELVQGETLAQRLRRSRLSTAESMAVLRQVCDAVGYAHSKDLIHRDLKPSNIIIGNDGQVKVVDFGLAVPETRLPEERLTRSGIAVGTYEYCSPEQLAGEPVDARADIYSVGVIAYQLLTGELPVGAFDPPSLRRKAVAQGFDAVVMRALLTNREQRYPTAEAFRDALTAAHQTALLIGDIELIGQDQAKVLQDFYEKTVFDVPPTVRHFIEDKLLTPSGYRDSRPLDDALVNHGISRPQLDRLVERHLLRIEERAGIPRVEISHDRLTGAIQASRDSRRATQALQAAKEREKQLRRQKRIGVTIAALIALAVTAGVWGWSKEHAAQRAAADERQARQLLLEMTQMTGGDLPDRLEPLARLGVLDPVISAMDSLFSRYPPAKGDPAWNQLHAVYLTQKAGVQSARGHYTDAGISLRAALAIPNGLDTAQSVRQRTLLMRHLSARGLGNDALQEWTALQTLLQSLPVSADTGYATAMAEDARSRALLSMRNRDEGISTQQSAIATLEKVIGTLPPNNSNGSRWKHDLAQMYLRLAPALMDENQSPAALEAARRGNELASALAESQGADPRWAATHARSWSVMGDVLPDDKKDEAYKTGLAITTRLVARDPENMLWLREHALALAQVGKPLENSSQPDDALPYYTQVLAAAERISLVDPSVEQSQWDLASYLLHRGYVDKKAKRPGLAEDWLRRGINLMEKFVQSGDGVVTDRISGLGVAVVNLGSALRDGQKNAEALQLYDQWIERARRDAATIPAWHFLAAIEGWEKGSLLTATGDIPAALKALSEATADLEQAYRTMPPQHWPSPGWPWRGRPAKVLAAAINAAGAADKAEAKRIGAVALELLLRFRQRPIPENDASACAELQALTQ